MDLCFATARLILFVFMSRIMRDVVLALAKNDAEQNIIYQELHLDYPLMRNGEFYGSGYGRIPKRPKESPKNYTV